MQLMLLYTHISVLAMFSFVFFFFQQMLQIMTEHSFDFRAFFHYNDHTLFILGGPMKKVSFLILFLLVFLITACADSTPAQETTIPETRSATIAPAATIAVTIPTEPETVATTPEPVLELSTKDQNMLLKIAMAERGNQDCTECIALVMRTVLNRVEAGGFGRNIRGVIFAPGQFTPVADGSYHSAVPNEQCCEALKMVIHGWDESQGALYYEWCEGESWHSQNLHLLFQHCDVRFYK